MRNCSGVRMASHSSSDFCTGPGGGGADDDIATKPGNRRPTVLQHRPAAGLSAELQYGREHERETGRGGAGLGAAVEEGVRREESAERGRVVGGAAGWEWDAILSFSRCWTPIFLAYLVSFSGSL